MERAQGIAFDDSRFDASVTPAGTLGQVSLKPWCAAKQTVAAITGFRDILAKGIGADEIASIAVRTPPAYTPMISPKGPEAGHTARIIGIDYQLALAALKPDELDNIARPDESGDPRFAALMQTVSIEADESLARHFPVHWPATVTVTTGDGRTESVTTLVGEGDPDRPLTPAAVKEKAIRICARAHGQPVAEEIAGLADKAASDDAALARLGDRLAALTRAAMAG
jgi:2-methylcitrate dehydratase PrpD